MKKTYYWTALSLFILLIYAGVDSYSEDKSETEQEMEIKRIVFDQNTQSPVVLLANKDLSSVLPIWVGLCEARSIELNSSELVAPRPMTYDLIAAILRTMNASIERIVIVDLRDEVFYAQVEVSVNGKVSKIDARPSDAIALAIRMKSPIFVTQRVLEKSALPEPGIEKHGL